MTEHASQEITIEVRAPYVLEAVLELDEYKLWIPEFKSVAVLDRDDRGRALIACLTTEAMGKTITQEYVYNYDNYPDEISWSLVHGDMAKSLKGSYKVRQYDDKTTRVSYDLEVDLDVAIPGFLKRKLANKIVSSALENLKKWCEDPNRFN